jgi:hypothetical protein
MRQRDRFPFESFNRPRSDASGDLQGSSPASRDLGNAFFGMPAWRWFLARLAGLDILSHHQGSDLVPSVRCVALTRPVVLQIIQVSLLAKNMQD